MGPGHKQIISVEKLHEFSNLKGNKLFACDVKARQQK